MSLPRSGANVVAVDLDERKFELAKKMGAQFTVNAKKAEDVAMAVFDITHGGAHVSVDALVSRLPAAIRF
jgi:alcohol dehydrogenase